MKASGFWVCASFAGCAVIAACSQAGGVSRFQYTPSVISQRDLGDAALSYRVLHSFDGHRDGNGPEAGVIRLGDTFYGTTALGGLRGGGTIYALDTGGAEKTLHNFGREGGREPYGSLIDVNGTLYGTAGYGGRYEYGTVFSVTTDGRERVLHDFGKGTDGELPAEALINVGGTLYGVTENGGAEDCRGYNDGCGTVFSITTDGAEKVVHRFGNGADGRFPAAGVTDAGGTLYGTTIAGGTYTYGTVFSVTTSGKERVLHSFGGAHDGTAPAYASLIEVNGALYGTTESGGAHNAGTVYRITRDGSEKVLHSFGDGTDGNFPAGSLLNIDGTLYGTTADGGAYGLGTLFRVTTGGREAVLHDFGKGTDGSSPAAPLIYTKGSLYGTTQAGGLYGDGTVFSLRLANLNI